jgi:hypothetical protein
LKKHRRRHRLPHGLLQAFRPGVEGCPVQKYGPRDVKMVRGGVEPMKLVRAVSYRVGERVFQRIKGAGFDSGNRSVKSMRKGTAPVARRS